MKLYLLPMGSVREDQQIPIEAYLIVRDDGSAVLVDTGCTRDLVDDQTAPFAVSAQDHIVARLASVGLTPREVGQVVCTHLDPDHCGGVEEFPHAELIVQRRQLAAARDSGEMRYEWMRRHWDLPGARWRELDGDTSLHPGSQIIDSSGHAPGHQSVLVHLPETGPVLLAGDAIAHHDLLDPDTRFVGHHDWDETETRASTRKLVDLAAREGVSLIVHSHDAEQWSALRKAPDCYE